MSQVARQICEIAIRELGLNRIKANVFSPNVASQRVLLKNGFMLKETMFKAAIKGDNVYDILIYNLLK